MWQWVHPFLSHGRQKKLGVAILRKRLDFFIIRFEVCQLGHSGTCTKCVDLNTALSQFIVSCIIFLLAVYMMVIPLFGKEVISMVPLLSDMVIKSYSCRWKFMINDIRNDHTLSYHRCLLKLTGFLLCPKLYIMWVFLA